MSHFKQKQHINKQFNILKVENTKYLHNYLTLKVEQFIKH
jgi:hypothetical protein